MRTLLTVGVGVLLTLVIVSACNQGARKHANEWLPFIGWATENFVDNRASLEALESMLLASNYNHVSGSGVTVGKYSMAGGFENEEIIEDNERWVHLLKTSNVFAVARHDGYTGYPTGINPFWDKKDYQNVDGHSELLGTLTYIHVRNMDEEEIACLEHYKESKCGACVVSLAPDWLAYFTWSAASFTPTSIEKGLEPKLEREAIEALSQQAYESCYSDWNEMTALSPE